MKQRQTVPKPLTIAILVIMFICMASITAAMAQVQPKRGETGKEYSQRLQKVNSYEYSRANWKKNELSAAKDYRKAKREKARGRKEKQREKFLSKIDRIKNE